MLLKCYIPTYIMRADIYLQHCMPEKQQNEYDVHFCPISYFVGLEKKPILHTKKFRGPF